jgi:hypothetical protein
MTWGTLKGRNACPFSVTFYALAGPSIELPANSTRSAKACLIWFSTRVKGGGETMNIGTFEGLRDDYINQLSDLGYSSADWEEGGSGAAAGSILGVAVSVLDGIFKVKNTRDGSSNYFGAKKEAVYGNSDLVVYATLDKACRLDPSMDKIWYLHLEKDHGQVSDQPNVDPAYSVPDLSQYADAFFFRVRNIAHNTFLYAKDDNSNVGVRAADIPFNPLTMREYWSVNPLDAGDATHNVKILNPATNRWLTAFTSEDNRIGLYPVGYTDYPDQHWNLTEVSQAPETVKITKLGSNGNLTGADSDHTFLYPNIDSADDQKWRIETFTTDVGNLPKDRSFRIMHAKTGLFFYAMEDKKIKMVTDLGALDNFFDHFGVHAAYFTLVESSPGVYKVKSTKYNSYLTFYENDKYLGLYPEGYGDYPDQHWNIVTESHHAGFYMRNQASAFGGSNYLFYDGSKIGVYNGTYPDQLWVAVLD